MRHRVPAAIAGASLIALTFGVGVNAEQAHSTAPGSRAPSSLKPIAKLDERFQSYNVEMAEVAGGKFWAPYPKSGESAPVAHAEQGGIYASTAFRKRAPVDLTARRLRTLAKALGPSYVRVSGTWANSVHFQESDGPSATPAGYNDVLTRAQWAGVLNFAKAVDAKIVTSFATSEGARNADHAWNPDQARRLVEYTRSL